MGNRLTKSSVLAGVLVAGCLLGGQAVLAEEVSLDQGLSTELLPTQAGDSLETDKMKAVSDEVVDENMEVQTETLQTIEQAVAIEELLEEEMENVDAPQSSSTEEVELVNVENPTNTADDSILNMVDEEVELVNVENPTNTTDDSILNMVDEAASQETMELFGYLKEKADSPDILFGQQHALDEGVSLIGEGSRVGSTESEVKNAVGDYPAIFGWDTLSLDGYEKPGVAGDPDQSLKNVIESMKTAHALGGVVVLSMHPYNFVTGGNFNDTSGNVVSEILPGGTKNQEFNQWLDRIASLAEGLKDEDGKDIPLIFRPFHEQNGSWFWWGASTTKPDQYKALYRYTVEYLRDQKNIHNILYVYSPNTPTPGDLERYLETYPGDAYVDIFGIDSYDSKDNAGSEQFLSGLVKDLSMIVDLAEQKGKVAALTEFGYSAQGINKTGNTLDWYSRVFNAIQADQKASKIAYMLTWANFGLPNNVYVPYRDVNGNLGGDHELLPDFENFYHHTNTIFAREVGQIYGTGKNYQTSPVADSAYLIRPANGDIIRQQEFRVVVKASQEDDAVSVEIGNKMYDLIKEGQYFTASITLPSELDNQVLTATIRYSSKGQETKQEQVKLYTRFGQEIESPLVVDTFEQYFGDSSLLHQAYSSNGDKIEIHLSEHQKQGGQYGMVYDFEVGDKGYAGRQISFEKNWQGTNALTFWLKHTGYPQHLTVQIRIGNVSYEKNIALNEAFEGLVTLPLVEFLPAAWEGNQNARIDQIGLGQVTQFAFYLGGEKGKGTLYIDDIQAIKIEGLPTIADKYDPAEASYQPMIYSFLEEVGKWNGPDLKIEEGQLLATISGAKDQKTEINLQANQDLSSYNWYVAKLRSATPIQAKLYVKVGDSWQWLNNEIVTVSDQWTSLQFDLSGVAERATTREIGIEFLGEGNEDQVQVYIDQISFVKDLEELKENIDQENPVIEEPIDIDQSSQEENPNNENGKENISSGDTEQNIKSISDKLGTIPTVQEVNHLMGITTSQNSLDSKSDSSSSTSQNSLDSKSDSSSSNSQNSLDSKSDSSSSNSSKTMPKKGDSNSVSFIFLGLSLLLLSVTQILKRKRN